MHDCWPPVAPQRLSLEVGPVGAAAMAVEMLAEMLVETLVVGGAGVESRYQFAFGSFRHSPIVTAWRPLL